VLISLEKREPGRRSRTSVVARAIRKSPVDVASGDAVSIVLRLRSLTLTLLRMSDNRQGGLLFVSAADAAGLAGDLVPASVRCRP
jgi:hypothetical protein